MVNKVMLGSTRTFQNTSTRRIERRSLAEAKEVAISVTKGRFAITGASRGASLTPRRSPCGLPKLMLKARHPAKGIWADVEWQGPCRPGCDVQPDEPTAGKLNSS
jgi:hypothetical protein